MQDEQYNYNGTKGELQMDQTDQDISILTLPEQDRPSPSDLEKEREASTKPQINFRLMWQFTVDSFRIRFFTMCLIILVMSATVCVTVLLFGISDVLPVVLFKSEMDSRGIDKADLKMFSYSQPTYMNYSNLQQSIQDLPEVFAAPRMYKMCYIEDRDKDPIKTGHFKANNKTEMENLAFNLIHNTIPLTLVLLDYESEENLKYFDDLQPLKPGEVALVGNIAGEDGKYSVGDMITIVVKESLFERKMLNRWKNERKSDSKSKIELGVYKIKVKIGQILERVSYRVHLSYRSGIIADINTFQQQMISFRSQQFPEDKGFNEYLMKINFTHYASSFKFRLGNPKDIYYFNDLSNMRREFNKRVAKLTSRMEVQNGNVVFKAPMIERMQDRESYLNLMSTVFVLVLGFCLLLAAYVVSNVYTMIIYDRQTEIAIMRNLGIRKTQIYSLFLTQSLIIALLSLALSFAPLGFLFNKLNSSFFEKVIENVTIGYDLKGVLVGFFFGVIIPFSATIQPLREITKSSIVVGLDPARSNNTASETKVEHNRHEDSYSHSVIVCCMIANFYGGSLYFGMPYTFLKGDIFFISIFLIILFASTAVGIGFMILGVLPLFEWVSKRIMFFEKEFLKRIVIVNTKTNRYYSMPTIYIVFTGISIITIISQIAGFFQSTAIETDYRSQGGRFVLIGNFENSKLAQKTHSFLIRSTNDVAIVSNQIESFYGNKDSPNAIRSYDRIKITTTGGMLDVDDKIRTATPNFPQVSNYDTYSKIGTFSQRTTLTPFEFLYTRFGHGTFLMSESSRKDLGINCDLNKTSYFSLTFASTDTDQRYFKVPCSGSYFRLPGVYMRDFLNNPEKQEMITDIISGFFLYNSTKDFDWERIRVWKYLIKPKNGKLNEEMMNHLNDHFSEGLEDQLYRRYYFSEGMKQKAENPSGDIFLFLRFIEVALYLLMLIRFTYGMSHILVKQKKSMGVLMSIGMRPIEIAKVYFYEVYMIIVTSGLISASIICVMSFLFGIQMETCLDVVYRFKFPWSAILGSLFYGLVLALVSVGIPVYYLVRDNMVNLLRINQ